LWGDVPRARGDEDMDCVRRLLSELAETVPPPTPRAGGLTDDEAPPRRRGSGTAIARWLPRRPAGEPVVIFWTISNWADSPPFAC